MVLTIAHGDLAYAAARCARQADLPMVTIFHDWWLDIRPSSGSMRKGADYRFLQLHRESSISFPVSAGMLHALGPHRAATVLYPIPEARELSPPPATSPSSRPFRVVYAGNLKEYGHMVGEALQESLHRPDIQLEVRGRDPAAGP